jgi:hypothetical protein
MERFGITLSKLVHQELVKQIQSGKATCLGRRTLRISYWRVTLDGRDIPVVYDNSRHVIVTVLPSEPKSSAQSQSSEASN